MESNAILQNTPKSLIIFNLKELLTMKNREQVIYENEWRTNIESGSLYLEHKNAKHKKKPNEIWKRK